MTRHDRIVEYWKPNSFRYITMRQHALFIEIINSDLDWFMVESDKLGLLKDGVFEQYKRSKKLKKLLE
jgi:hypothetical protein